jgi:hypothetical protein
MSASAAPLAAAIYDSNDSPTMGKVSDIVDDDNTTVVDDDTSDSNDKTSNDNNKTVDPLFFCAARDIMNRVRRKVGTMAREDCPLCEHFDVPFTIVQMVWDMLEERGLLPKEGEPKHLLWALYFLKCYPKEGPGCTVVGGSKGAIDPKTMRKWVWLLLERICKLADHVVSLFSRHVFTNKISPFLSLLLLSRKTTD